MRSPVPALAVVAAAVLAAPAPADHHRDPHAVVAHIFATADTDRSGTLSRAEYDAADLQRFGGITFDQCDADADGETSLAEYLAVYDRFHPRGDQVGI
jgi:hypothetical protein